MTTMNYNKSYRKGTAALYGTTARNDKPVMSDKYLNMLVKAKATMRRQHPSWSDLEVDTRAKEWVNKKFTVL